MKSKIRSGRRSPFLRYSALFLLFAVVVSVLLALINFRVAEAAPPNFAASQTVTVNSRPYNLAVGDINRDGRPDIAIGYAENTNSLSVLINNTTPGAASTTFASKQDFVVGAAPTGVELADINGDGNLDLIVAVRNAPFVSVLLNTTPAGFAAATFATHQDFPGGIAPLTVTAGDLNGDGRPDVALVNECGGCDTVSVLLNTTSPGSGTVGLSPKVDFATGANPKSVVMGDLNNDGKLDLIVANNLPANSVSVLINTMSPGATTPSFTAKQDFATPNAIWTATVGDINGDGKLDIAASIGSGGVSVFLNTTTFGSTTATFAPRTDFFSVGLTSVVAKDFNGDGRLDLAGSASDVNRLVVFANTTVPGATTPTFAFRQEFGAGTGSISTSAGDLNLDGKIDLITANITGLSLSVFVNTTNQGPATPGFTPELSFGVEQSAGSVVLGDLNLDGRRDLIVCLANHTVSILRNMTNPGSTTPSYAAPQNITSFTTPFASAVGDLNGDGKPDLAVANFDSANVSVFLNTTTPGATSFSFAPRQEFDTGNWETGVALGDVNGDGKLDVAVSNGASSTISVLLNTTAPGDLVASFAPKQDFVPGTSPFSVVLADFNKDGRVDLAVANRDSSSLSVLLNTTAAGATTPSFGAKMDLGLGTTPRYIAVGDLNLDGKLDLAVSSDGAGLNLVSVFLNTTVPGAANPTFAPIQDFASGINPRAVTLCDLNGDGKLDITVANNTDNNVSLFVNTTAPGSGTLSFAARRNLNTGTGPQSVIAGDLNGDGKADLSVANGAAQSVSVMLNVPVVSAATGLTRQQGSPASNSQIAMVTNYGGNSSVSVTVISANPSNGVTVSNIVNTNGNITADIIASCSASGATFTLQASDGSSSVTTPLSVGVTANTEPTVIYANQPAIAFRGTTSVTPTTVSDNGSITSYTVFSVVPAMSPAPTINSAGVISITNAQPAGPHTITIRYTDNCGVASNSAFALTVNKADTTTTVSSSLNPSALGESVTLTATVASSGGTPTGAAQFKIDGVNSGNAVALNGSGVAQLTISSLTSGAHTVTADYNGANNFNFSSGTLSGGQVVNNRPLISFNPSSYNVGESSGFVTITVTRTGDTAPAVTVDYSTSGDNGLPCSNASGAATPKCDFTAALGTLSFAAGETSKTITIPISQDSFVEGPETFSLSLSNATPGAGIASPTSATITITDDATEPPTNPSDDARNFVRQHYHDFLNREPDQSGWDFWTNQITSCGNDVQCNEARRIDVSASFFLSIEFQQSGYLVERFYKVAYGDVTGTSTFGGFHQLPVPIARASEFLKDTQRIGRGVIVLQPGWEQLLEDNKQAYALEFVQTTRFITALPSTMTPAQFVDTLNQNSGGPLTLSERQAAIDLFGGAGNSSNVTARAQAVRMVAEDQTLYDAEFNRAFVLSQYVGYLRRNPNDAPDSDYTGYDFWLTKLNQFNGNYIQAEMVKAFLSSIEYRQRFGP